MTKTTFMGKPIPVEMLSSVIDKLTDREELLAEIAQALRAAMDGSADQQAQAKAMLSAANQIIGRIDAANLPYRTHPDVPMTEEDHRWHWHLNRGIWPEQPA